jgi:hypothetical protein
MTAVRAVSEPQTSLEHEAKFQRSNVQKTNVASMAALSPMCAIFAQCQKFQNKEQHGC